MANRAARRHPERHGKQNGQASSSGGVCVAYCHPVGEVGAAFHTSLIDLIVYDSKTSGHITRHGAHAPMSSGANINAARNKVVRTFLEKTRAEWLWWLDADMSFAPDTLDRMLASADAKERPILGALCFAVLRGEAQEVVPTLYGFTSANQMVRYNGFPEDQVIQVVGTGSACILIHRSVFEAILEKFPPPFPWYAETITGENWGDTISEDLTFCLRAAHVGFPVHVDTSIEIGHTKPVVIDKAYFYKSLPAEEEPAPTFVVIPVKGKEHFTAEILNTLGEQGGYERIFLYDNASGTDDAYTGPLPENCDLIPAAGKSIHQMWNMGIRASLAQSQRCNVAILNNDLELGPEFLERLAKGLRAHPSIAAVSPNYDKREFPEMVQAVKGIAAGREDGTGGLAGFAFMARGELWTAGCPMFDEQFELWYGDNDFVNNLDAAGATYGIVRDATCVHIGGGSNTSGDGKGKRLSKEWRAVAEADRAKFEAKWG